MSDAIVLTDVVKRFRKTSLRKDHTTFKSELLRLVRGERKLLEAGTVIEAIKGASFTVKQGSTVALVGRNGSGKSTLLKLITGIYSPTSGNVKVNGRVSALLELGAGFHPDFTGRENILINGIILGMSRSEVKARTEQIIEFAELGDFIEEPVRTYSSGMFMRLAFAVATHVDPDILIIDEILSVGDEHFQRKSQAKMEEFKKAGKTIVVVSHSLATVESWCDQAVWLDAGTVRLVGPPKHVVTQYKNAISAAEAEALKTGMGFAAPGGSLPDSGEQLPPPGEVKAIRVRDARGQACEAYAANERLDVYVDYQVHRAHEFQITLDLHDAGMRLLLRTGFWAGHLEPGPGTAKLSFPRLGLGEGGYQLTAGLHLKKIPPATVARQPFIVAPFGNEVGILRPEFQWTLEGDAGAKRSTTESTVGPVSA